MAFYGVQLGKSTQLPKACLHSIPMITLTICHPPSHPTAYSNLRAKPIVNLGGSNPAGSTTDNIWLIPGDFQSNASLLRIFFDLSSVYIEGSKGSSSIRGSSYGIPNGFSQ